MTAAQKRKALIPELLAKYNRERRRTGSNIPMPSINVLHHYYFVNTFTVRPHWRKRPARR